MEGPTWLASTPKCHVERGPHSDRIPCGLPLRWEMAKTPEDGLWWCRLHGPVLDGVDAALRAGYLSFVYVEAT